MYKAILVPLDCSKSAEAILNHVEKMKLDTDATVFILHVNAPPVMLGYDEVIDISGYERQRECRKKEIEVYLKTIGERFRVKGISTKICVTSGPVVETILNTARKESIDLIALASRGLDYSYRTVYGGVAAGLLKNASIPLLILRYADEPPL